MLRTLVGLAEILAVVLVVDRVLLAAEARGWINYRRKGLNLGAARYHVLGTQSVFDPGAEVLREAQVGAEEEAEEDESGEPPVDSPDPPGHSPSGG